MITACASLIAAFASADTRHTEEALELAVDMLEFVMRICNDDAVRWCANCAHLAHSPRACPVSAEHRPTKHEQWWRTHCVSLLDSLQRTLERKESALRLRLGERVSAATRHA